MIVFPMAGRSQRFAEAGYIGPKYRLLAHERPLLWHSVHGFRGLFVDEPFVFASLAEDDAEDDVRRVATSCRIARWRHVALPQATAGQAETVRQAIDLVDAGDDEPLTIFNIDTIHRRYHRPDAFELGTVDGYLEVFRGDGAQWSFVRVRNESSDRVVETTEKRRVSDLCCTGLYYFRRCGDYRLATRQQASGDPRAAGAGERYVAPLYNLLIAWQRDIRAVRIEPDRVVFSGIPREYEAFRDGPRLADEE